MCMRVRSFYATRVERYRNLGRHAEAAALQREVSAYGTTTRDGDQAMLSGLPFHRTHAEVEVVCCARQLHASLPNQFVQDITVQDFSLPD